MAIRDISERVVTGDRLRRTRFHNYRGQRIDAAGLAYLPLAAMSALMFKLTGRRPEIPWLGYRAIRRLGELIRPDWRVLEWGSGMSSLWLARRCRQLVYLETDAEWYVRMLGEFRRAGLTNVICGYCATDYCLRAESEPDGSFDFAMVGGLISPEISAEAAVRKVRAGGYVFLDNSDVQRDGHRAARRLLLDAAVEGSVEVFNDFTPAQVAVQEGTLIRVR
jgi:hypothetical protein